MNLQLHILFVASCIVAPVFAGNILVLCPVCTRSHKSVMEATVEGLAKRNHTVTIVSAHRTSTNNPNIRDVIVLDGKPVFCDQNLLEARKAGVFAAIVHSNYLYRTVIDACHAAYQNPEFMRLINETFDLIFIDAAFNQCVHGFAHKLKAPIIRSMPVPSNAGASIHFGNYLPPSFVPDPLLPFSHEMNLLQRMANFVLPKLIALSYNSWYGEYEKIYRDYLGQGIPGLEQLELDMSMMLVNAHFSINHPRPAMPDVVDIGGVHCRPGNPLPDNLEEFISGGSDGIILFSLGSILKSDHMPEETRKAFRDAFSRVKQRVLWKWDHDDMPDLPSNVKLSKWLPVQDILSHPKTKLFVTHGGLLSTQEAIYHGVPLVGMPMIADQDVNIKRCVDAGVSVFVEILNVQAEDISAAIETVLNNPEYKHNAERLSTLYRDRPQTAIETAVFWSEYVMRHKGAPQLRSAARKLNFIQYHCLDVLAILFCLLLASAGITYALATMAYRKLFKKTQVTDRIKKSI